VRISTICTCTLRPTGGQFFGFFHGHPNYQVWFSFCTYANSNISLPSGTCENHRDPN
jgi:proteasome lid subunit RPN8/RPN11